MSSTLKLMFQCAFMAMVPVIELRGALPWGITQGLPVPLAYGLCVVCNMIPVPFILLFINKILEWMDGHPTLCPISQWIEEHGHKKLEKYQKYHMLGLFLLVAIPLPGTGAWTGALVAALTKLPMRKAFPMILLGVAAAGIIVLLVTVGAVAVFG